MDYSAILVPLMTMLFTLAFAFNLGRFRFSGYTMVTILGVEISIVVLFSSLILMIGGLEVYARWYVPIMVIPTLLMFLYISERRDARDLFTIVTTIFLNFSISIPAIWFAHLYACGYVGYSIARLVLFFVVFLLIHTFFRKHYLMVQDIVDKGWLIFSILPVIGSAIIYYGFLWFGQSGNLVEVLYLLAVTIVFMGSIYVVTFYMFQQLHEKYMVGEQRRTLAIQNKAQLDQHILFKEVAERSNRRWHDMRHNTQTLIELLEAGDTSAALSYLKGPMGIEDMPKEEYCLHSAVNSILYLWRGRARKEDISMEIAVPLPETLAIDPLELSALFANAIENAYYACLELPNDGKRFIRVEAHYNGKRLAIAITNSCPSDILFSEGIPISKKEGGGIGTRSIVYTVKRFKGTFSFTAEDGIFSSRFVLNV